MSKSEFIKRWFGFTRRERSGTYILAIILLFLIIVRFALNKQALRADSYNKIVRPELPLDSIGVSDSSYQALRPVKFDPNSVSLEEMVSMGLSYNQAKVVDNYRIKGGVFRIPDDFRKIYSISEDQKDKLIPYIEIDKKHRPAQQEEKDSLIAYRNEKEESIVRNKPVYPAYSATIIELNSVDSLGLIQLKGIGKVLSSRIIKYRNLLGGYIEVDQLNEVYGIDSTLLSILRPYIVVDSSKIMKLDLNKASYSDLLRHPYITRDQTDQIFKYREFSGLFKATGELIINKIFTIDDYNRLKPYIFLGDTIQYP